MSKTIHQDSDSMSKTTSTHIETYLKSGIGINVVTERYINKPEALAIDVLIPNYPGAAARFDLKQAEALIFVLRAALADIAKGTDS